jgi:NADH-quinone oxidoreductase subunit A
VDGILPVVIMVGLGMVFAAMGAFLPGLLAVRRPTMAKEAPYECGIVPTREPAERFPVRFYLIAMIFIIFDIEIIFLYPWAVIFDRLDLFGLVEMVVFAIAVVVSFGYLLSNGALDWGPAKASRSVAPADAQPAGTTAEPRTSRSTVRKVSRGDRAA